MVKHADTLKQKKWILYKFATIQTGYNCCTKVNPNLKNHKTFDIPITLSDDVIEYHCFKTRNFVRQCSVVRLYWGFIDYVNVPLKGGNNPRLMSGATLEFITLKMH